MITRSIKDGMNEKSGLTSAQTVDKKLFSPRRGRIAFSANERIAEFLSFAIRAKFAYVSKLGGDCITADLLLMMIEVDFTACYNTNQNSPA